MNKPEQTDPTDPDAITLVTAFGGPVRPALMSSQPTLRDEIDDVCYRIAHRTGRYGIELGVSQAVNGKFVGLAVIGLEREQDSRSIVLAVEADTRDEAFEQLLWRALRCEAGITTDLTPTAPTLASRGDTRERTGATVGGGTPGAGRRLASGVRTTKAGVK